MAFSQPLSDLRSIAPGVLLSTGLALVAWLSERLLREAAWAGSRLAYVPPAIVIALLLGIVFHTLGSKEVFRLGLLWCIRKLLRIAIAFLGMRIAVGEIIALGASTALLVMMSMALTITVGLLLARALKLGDGYGLLAGAATAVCGASATLATATVVPDYPQKSADVTFTVVAANAGSTLVMVAYPPLCHLLGLDPLPTGIMLGATIHDMAQVAGAGYSVSNLVGNVAVIVKLFRVLLLLPVVLLIGWWFVRRGKTTGAARVPVPVFALAFLALCLFNSIMLLLPNLSPYYAPVKTLVGQASTWGVLIAIAALGLGTSLRALLAIGWRHIVLFTCTTLTTLSVITSGLLLLR